MRAFAVTPRKPGSGRVVDIPHPEPGEGEVPVRVIEVGICGTDAEINMGLYGDPPKGEDILVLGHEALGRLEDGSLVVPMVRRPCGECPNCIQGAQDMCETGRFREIGIKEAHGAIRDHITEAPERLIPIPKESRPYAVLTEPMSVVAKGLRHALFIQKRLIWTPRRALVLGAGPIGLLAAMTLRTMGWTVLVVARRSGDSIKAGIAEAAGAKYHSAKERSIPELVADAEPFDLIFEATGSAVAAFDCIPGLAINGVLCLTSVTGGNAQKTIPIEKINYDMVLKNQLIFGTVNAHRSDYIAGLGHLKKIEDQFPGLLEKLITARVSWDRAPELFDIQKDGIKTVFTLEG